MRRLLIAVLACTVILVIVGEVVAQTILFSHSFPTTPPGI